MFNRLLIPLLLSSLVVAGPMALAKGDIYKWVDKDGVIHYGSEPPSENAKPAELPPLQTYKGAGKKTPLGTLESSSTALPSAAASGAAEIAKVTEIRVTSPEPDAVVREASVVVSASVSPASPAGAAYVFYLDGKRQNEKPQPAPSYTINNVERGSHSAVVAGIDPGGREFKRSAAVNFTVKPSVDGNPPPRLPGNTLPPPLPNPAKARGR